MDLMRPCPIGEGPAFQAEEASSILAGRSKLCTGGRVIMRGVATSIYVGLSPARYSNNWAFGIAVVHLAFNQT